MDYISLTVIQPELIVFRRISNDFDFEIVNFPFWDGDDPLSKSYGVYISQLIRFARASSYVADFKVRKRAKIRNRYNEVPHMT